MTTSAAWRSVKTTLHPADAPPSRRVGTRRTGPASPAGAADHPADQGFPEEFRSCDNSLGPDGTPSFCKAHVNVQLIKSRSATARNLLHRVWWGLKETGAKLANGRRVFNRNDAVVWLIEQLQERP